MEVRGWFAGIALALLLCGLAQPARGDVFRPFAADSPWNVPATSKGPIEPLNPYVAELGAPGLDLAISGIPPESDYAKPTFFADPGDPVTSTVTLTTDWSPNGDLEWDGGPIPVPAGAAPAPGSDGHLAIVSADRSTAWELWRCTSFGPDGITAAVIAQWDLTGPGYSADIRENSARASGTPIVSTALRADEAIEGIGHALGLTVPAVSSDYLYPVASHSDGLLGPGSDQVRDAVRAPGRLPRSRRCVDRRAKRDRGAQTLRSLRRRPGRELRARCGQQPPRPVAASGTHRHHARHPPRGFQTGSYAAVAAGVRGRRA